MDEDAVMGEPSKVIKEHHENRGLCLPADERSLACDDSRIVSGYPLTLWRWL